jgi:uncharacterized protein YkwD
MRGGSLCRVELLRFGLNRSVRIVSRMQPFRSSTILLLALTAAASAPVFAQNFIASSNSATVAEQYLLSAANQERESRGLPLLHRNSLLASAAEQHAQLMAEHRGISHQFPGEAELTNRGASAGVAFSAISENVAEAPSVVQIHDMWMHSEHHRENLLDPNIDSAGISVVVRGGELYAVEDFAKTVRAVNLNQQESAIASLVARSGPVTLARDSETVSTARQTCSMSTGFAGSRKPWFVMRFTSDSLNQIPGELKTRLATGKYHEAAVGACTSTGQSPFTSYAFAVLLYP